MTKERKLFLIRFDPDVLFIGLLIFFFFFVDDVNLADLFVLFNVSYL